jgi:hypothetical protein
MKNEFLLYIPEKSTGELEEIITHRKRYVPEAIAAAIEELKIRGRLFTDEEIRIIAEDKEAQHNAEKEKKSVYEQRWMPYFLVAMTLSVAIFFIVTINNDKRTPGAIFTSLALVIHMWLAYSRAKRKSK